LFYRWGQIKVPKGSSSEYRSQTQALEQFDPVWNSLTRREQARLVHLLIEQVGYDGRTGKVTASFRSVGLKGTMQRHRRHEDTNPIKTEPAVSIELRLAPARSRRSKVVEPPPSTRRPLRRDVSRASRA
jgi:hypothetical protein